MITHQNDWDGAVPLLKAAVERDPRFTLAQFFLFNVFLTLDRAPEASVAIAAAMDNLHRLPERTNFMIKTLYYYNEKKDADKAMAVLEMWSKIYPDDTNAYARSVPCEWHA